jgi:lysozyme
MKLSENGLSLLKSFEGCRLCPYNDKATKLDPNPPSGNASVGYGHMIHRGPLNGTEKSITEQEAETLLESDVHSKAEVFVDKIPANLNQNQYDSLVDFCYNLGCGTLSTLVSSTGLNAWRYDLVAAKILQYDKSRNQYGVLVPLPGLTRRRQSEADLFSKPVEG